jgi:hypothetical protein
MKCRYFATLVAATLLTAVTSGDAQSPSRDELMKRVADYVQRFIDAFSNVVAEEEYVQQFQDARERRHLKSDLLFVAYPGNTTGLITLRDVLELNGKPVRAKDERMTLLFLQPFDDAYRRALEIQFDGRRHGLGPRSWGDPWANPLGVLFLLQKSRQRTYRFTLGRRATELGPDVRELTMVASRSSETRTPLALQAPALPDPQPKLNRVGLPSRVRVWVSETSGGVVKTELSSDRLSTTTFRWDPGFGIHVPAELKDENPFGSTDTMLGTATYGDFRRFQVRTETAVAEPNP